MKKHSLKPKAINHYLKPFQPAVFFFNLPSLPHLVAQITEELTKSIVPPASSLGISSFIQNPPAVWQEEGISGVKGIYEVVLKEPFFISTV